MAFEIEGKVIDIQPVTKVSDKFKKREFVIEKRENGNTTQFIDYIKFQLVQDKCDIIDNSYLNTEVKVFFNIKGNRWEKEGKVNYFTNLDAWKIEKSGQIKPASPQPAGHLDDNFPPYISADEAESSGELDDLPF